MSATIQLRRTSRKDKAVRGSLQVEGTEQEIATLENADYIIPDGRYKVLISYSPRFRKDMPLIANVPGRSGIRIHGGTKPEHSKGCVLIASARDRERLFEFIQKNQNRHEETIIHISSAF